MTYDISGWLRQHVGQQYLPIDAATMASLTLICRRPAQLMGDISEEMI